MEVQEYLASFGRNGEFGRFLTTAPLRLRRGERVVACSARRRDRRSAVSGHAATRSLFCPIRPQANCCAVPARR